MFENEQPSRTQQLAGEYFRDDVFAVRQIVGRIRKNQIELFRTCGQITEYIRFDRIKIFQSELCSRLTDEIVMHGVEFDRSNAPCAARGEFVADGTRAGKEIEHVASLEIDQIVQYVEQILFGEIGRRTGPQIVRRVDRPPFVFAADYSHRTCLKNLPASLPTRRASLPAICKVYRLNGNAVSSRSMA